MLSLTKIFHFEMAHAIDGYSGACKYIHGHSYELHVTVASANGCNDYLPAPGFEIDFKEIKKMVMESVIKSLDHKLVLSRDYLAKNPELHSQENLVYWEAEPTAENILIYMQSVICEKLPPAISLAKLKLYETKNSYVTWVNTQTG